MNAARVSLVKRYADDYARVAAESPVPEWQLRERRCPTGIRPVSPTAVRGLAANEGLWLPALIRHVTEMQPYPAR